MSLIEVDKSNWKLYPLEEEYLKDLENAFDEYYKETGDGSFHRFIRKSFPKKEFLGIEGYYYLGNGCYLSIIELGSNISSLIGGGYRYTKSYTWGLRSKLFCSNSVEKIADKYKYPYIYDHMNGRE